MTPALNSFRIDWSKVIIPYSPEPSAISGRISPSLFSSMIARIAGVLIMISTAGASPLPSTRGRSRIETVAFITMASWCRIWSCWLGGKRSITRSMV
jgi:hypothetical protein